MIKRVVTPPGSHGLDEIVADNARFHIERMSSGHFWFVVESDGEEVHVNLSSSHVIRVNVERRLTKSGGG